MCQVGKKQERLGAWVFNVNCKWGLLERGPFSCDTVTLGLGVRKKTSQELQMLSSVTLNCQILDPGSQ